MDFSASSILFDLPLKNIQTNSFTATIRVFARIQFFNAYDFIKQYQS